VPKCQKLKRVVRPLWPRTLWYRLIFATIRKECGTERVNATDTKTDHLRATSVILHADSHSQVQHSQLTHRRQAQLTAETTKLTKSLHQRRLNCACVSSLIYIWQTAASSNTQSTRNTITCQPCNYTTDKHM